MFCTFGCPDLSLTIASYYTPKDVAKDFKFYRERPPLSLVKTRRLLSVLGFDLKVVLGCEGRSENVCFVTKKLQESLKLSSGKEGQKPML